MPVFPSPGPQHWIVGLGNPGPEYEDTPHNLGFRVIAELAGRAGVRVHRREAQALTGRAEIGGRSVGLAAPQTYMNLSGGSVKQLLVKYQAEPANLTVICDELDLPLGTLRLRERGSAGTHNGMRSVVAALGTQDFSRLRLGIAPPHPVSDAATYVLTRWGKSQRAAADEMVSAAADAIELMLREGMARAMTRVNAREGAGAGPEAPVS